MLSTQQGQRLEDGDTTDVPCFDEVTVNPASGCTCTTSTTEANRAWPNSPEAPDERTGFAECPPLERTDTWGHEYSNQPAGEW